MTSSQSSNNPLHKQLQHQKFLHTATYVEQSTNGIKKLSSSELAYINQLVTEEKGDPWRFEPIEITIPTGKKHSFNVISNPLNRAREIIGNAYLKCGNSGVLEGAFYLYSTLVLEHLFIDANRRTAALAAYWLLQAYQKEVDIQAFIDTPIGDLRDTQNLESLKKTLFNLIS